MMVLWGGLRIMKKTTTVIATLFVMLLFLPAVATAQENVKTTEHTVNVSTNGEMKIREELTVMANTNETVEFLEFSIYDYEKVENLKVSIPGLNNTNPTYQDDVISYNISSLEFSNQSDPLDVDITYTLPKQTEKIEKTILSSETNDISVNLNEKEIFHSNIMSYGDHFEVTLYEPSETPASLPWIISIVLLVIMLGVVSIYSLKKQKSTKSDKIYGGSKELLNTQKKLLTQLLKELEKKHRERKISDDTYHKIKGKYKQEAVNTMKKLDDLKSEVK